MTFVPRITKLVLIGLALAGLAGPVCAAGIMPGNGGTVVLPTVLPPSLLNSMLSNTDSTAASNFDALGQKFGVQNGRLDFFSTHPEKNGNFKPLFRGGVGDGGFKLQLKW
jgi:hypothetical protein